MPELPSGTVTFLFTDIEGSTRLLAQLGAEAYAQALADHRHVIRTACATHGGVEVDTEGDAFFVAFPTAQGALAAAAAFSEGLAEGPIRVRVGVHTGTPLVADDHYVGMDVHRAARIAAAGHGGQVLVSATTAALTGSEGLRDLGEHRFKDLSAPERVYQLGEGEFPRLKTLYQTNLPVPVTPFVGRERELAEASDLLLEDDVRLLTLSGPGGTGKTRLALQAAAASGDDYPDGVWWVPLAPLADPALVLPAAGEVLVAKRDLAAEIGGKRLLLLLDNFEHVIDAARDVGALVAACPHLTVLVTSRERLQVAGEHEYAVPAMAPLDGFELFAARAQALGTEIDGDQAARELCKRLDNLPLALELAAARTKLFSPAQLLERLGQRLDLFKGGRDADPRQRTLRATIEWSYELLSPEEQQLFARLSVFAGGCAYDAAEEICDADEDTLQSLLDKSLLRRVSERFWMLETVREYSSEALEARDEVDSIRALHAEYMLQFAERGSTDVIGLASAEWLERIDVEQDNVRAALGWFASAQMAESLARLAGAVWTWWFIRGHPAEGLRWLGNARDLRTTSHEPRVRVLHGISAIAAREGGNFESAKSASKEAIELCRAAGDEAGLARALNGLGLTYFQMGNSGEGRRVLEESEQIARVTGSKDALVKALGNLGWMAIAEHDYARGRKLCGEALEISRELGDTQGIMVASYNIGESHLNEGDFDEAESLFAEVLRMAAAWGWHEGLLFPLEALAKIALGRGRPEKAAQLLGAASELREQLGQTDERVASATAEALAALGEPRFDAAFDSGCRLSPDEALAVALAPLD